MVYDPSAETEDDTEYDGFLSYASEWHALAAGASAGLVGGLTLHTPYHLAGIVYMMYIVSKATGVKLKQIMNKGVDIEGNEKLEREIGKEPWYALGGMVIFWVVTSGFFYFTGNTIHI